MFNPWLLEYEGTSFELSGPDTPFEVVSWEQAADIYAVDDAPAPRSDGLYVGQDFVEPGEITVTVKIDFTDAPYPVEECVRLAMQARSDLARAWRADSIRSQNGALAELTLGGEYIIEGRPRRAVFDDTHQSVGLIFADLPFVPAQLGAYIAGPDGGWQSATINLVPAQMGGIRSPLRSPLRTAADVDRSAPVVVGGQSPAFPIIEIRGPIQSGAQVEVFQRWRLYLNRGLSAMQRARIDTRPGRAATYLNNRPVQILDPRSSMLADCTLLPGSNIVTLRGASIEGTARTVLSWRDTKASI